VACRQILWIAVVRGRRHRGHGRHDRSDPLVRHVVVGLATFSASGNQSDCDQPLQMSGHVRLRAAEEVAEILDPQVLRRQAHQDGESNRVAQRREDRGRRLTSAERERDRSIGKHRC
jgi:hypothetical protein